MSALFDLPASPPSSRSARLLDDLNPAQRRAVEHAGSPMLVVAGAGSGKTRVLTRRIAHLLSERGAHPGEIMAITFTNKAAAEMKERVADLVGPRARSMWVSTFHSMCVRVMRREAKVLGMSSNFSIYDSDDTRRLITLVARDLDLDPKRYPARTLAIHISNLKNELVDAATAKDRATNDLERRVAEVYESYQRRLTESNSLDFDDLIMRTVELLQDHPDVAEHYHRRFKHVLVDEYQDTNHAQYTLVRELVGTGSDGVPPAELCVVGDADQSIYAFRGATIRNIVEFERDYPQATTILLEQNYRSTQTILTAANAVISRNPDRRDKRLWSDLGDGEKIVGYVADNEHDEAQFVANEIDRLVDSGEANNGEIAVFYRTNNQSRVFEEIFIRLGLPYKVVGGVRFYERREVRDALAYLRALSNPDDTVSLRRILNVPKRGIGDRAEACVSTYAERERIGFAQALRDAVVGRVPMLNPRSRNAIAGFVELMDELGVMVERGDDVADILEAVLERTAYRAELEASDDPQDHTRVENLNELVTVAREFTDLGTAVPVPDEDEGLPAEGSLGAFLERVSLVADADSVPDAESDGVVTLMTLHTAKGLEYPVVFCTGWEDGVFPHMRALGDPAELSEERRLAYVGITRAQQRLYLSRALVRSAWGQPSANPASRFLDEIPAELVDWRRVEPRRSAPSAPTSWGHSSSSPRPAPVNNQWKDTPAIKLDVGDRVTHDKYGLGRVVAVDGSGPRATATIDFGGSGTVRLMLIGGVPLVKL
ncbi:DNA helicase PcrA [Saccharothrix longispora]|uniref:ATP-dependent DNA helicase n=1 Tax=Saccharothrix longispora TaxID=33920 RepID=A0ABU1Q1I4_9PSEU|nr:DNA helicase PcrA [Saccharothrix longispora]MDR6596750.1 DNA helicase-2/ATP-dependent DNA helicase PcrA [Saccharothrix longispora]